jgi:predicted transcriptional regulator
MAEPEPSIFDQIDEVAEERALEEAETAYAAGQVISHEAMTRWLESWGKPDELPPPPVGS